MRPPDPTAVGPHTECGWRVWENPVTGERATIQVAAPPLTEPDLGAADGGADGLDGPAGEAQGNASIMSREFVVPGYLREAAAAGCPRRFYAGGTPGRFPAIRGFLAKAALETLTCPGNHNRARPRIQAIQPGGFATRLR
jgi:hypothetical protein